jgi:hypothetical protein
MGNLKMIDFCRKYNLAPYKLHRHLSEFTTINLPGWAKPHIIDNEDNAKLALYYSLNRSTRPKLPRLPVEDFMIKYNVRLCDLQKKWKYLKLEEVNGVIYVPEVKNNLRFLGIIGPNSI